LSGGIYVLTGDKKLAKLEERPYDSEDLLQALLADYPDILAGDQINPDAPRRWLLIKRELGVPGEEGGAGRWSLDHLFVDQEGIPTLIEVKRSTDTRIRREVVGQMLDYAANAMVYWSIQRIQASFASTCKERAVAPDAVMREFVGPAGEPDAFWQQVKTNLQAGRVRLLFVADEIPAELKRIVEFLNEQMDPAEVLALEIKQFANETLRTLVPRVIGQTAEAEQRKGTSKTPPQWDEGLFFDNLGRALPAEQVILVRRIYDWARSLPVEIVWGKARYGSFTLKIESAGARITFLTVYAGGTESGGKFELDFRHWARSPAFADGHAIVNVLAKLNKVPGVSLPPDPSKPYPSILLSALAANNGVEEFLQVMTWCLDQIRRSNTA
jgi:hypothetical protein